MFSAKALYNNVADAPDELSFSKGDVLEVHEKDDNGWWVCSLKGKVGIAPGNRLQIQSATGSSSRGVSPSGRNSPSTNQVLPSGQKLPPPTTPGSSVHLGQKSPANDQNARQNWHLSNKVVVPKKSGNVYVYEPPINQVVQDYDVPPSRHRDTRHGGVAVTSAQFNQNSSFDSVDALQNYDVPSSLRCSMQASPDNYDRLPAFTRNASPRMMDRDVLLPPKNAASSLIYDIPPAFSDMSELASNRSSVLSVLSTGSQSSACSGHSSLGGSVSARSSVDVSTHEIYDVPASSRAMSGAETGQRQLQTLAEQAMLDGPQSSPFAKKDFAKQNSAAGPPCSLKLQVDRDSYLEDYSVPRSDVSQGSGDSGISVSNVDPFGARTACAPEELYDMPRKLANDAATVQRCDLNQSKSEEITYDVPNQMNGRSRENNNSAVEGAAVGLDLSFVELDENGARTDIRSPTDILIQLQSMVLGHSSKLVGLISRILSDGGNQGQELSQIKLACLAMKTALKEVIDYGNGGLGQAVDSSSKELSEKVFELLDKVHVQLQYLSRHVEKLLTTQWPPRRREKNVLGGISELDDTLNTIGMLTEAVSGHLQTLTRFVLQNSSSLFRRSSSCGITVVENGVVSRDSNRTAKDDARCRPPLPPATKAKAKFGGQDSIERQSLATVQERPLPPVPCQASTISVCKYPRQQSSASQAANASGGTGFQENNSNEWNDDCDYVSIANEAEKEMKVCEKRLDKEEEPEKPSVGRNTHHEINKEAVCSGDNFSTGASPERKSTIPSPIGKVKYPSPPSSAPHSTIPTTSGVAASSGNTVSRVGGAHENGHAVDSRSLDSQNVAFYVDQSETHFTVVDSAVREFFQMIFNDRVTAKEFLLRSKFVILAAHKLVYIGDTITRNSLHSSSAQNNQIAVRANNLCDILKETVAATKTSALNFPQNLTQQRLIDCMKAVLQASLQLCEAIRSIAVRA